MSSRGYYILIVALPLIAALAFGYWSSERFGDLTRIVFDGYQRNAPRAFDPNLPVRIAAIDEKSVARFGQWPWPRAVMAQLVDKLAGAGTAVVGFDIVFAEPERAGLADLVRALPAGPDRDEIDKVLGRLPLGDDRLAASMSGTNVVLGTMMAPQGSTETLPTRFGIVTAGDDPLPFLGRFERAVLPLPSLSEAAAGIGALNWLPDRDQVVRRVPLLVRRGDQIVPGLAAECLRVAQGASTFILRASNASGEAGFGTQTGINMVRIGALEVPTDPRGEVRVAFTPTQPRRFISVADIIDGTFDPAEVQGAIVLVGMTAVGLLDQRATPIDTSVPGVEVHAQLIEHILVGAQLTRPDWAPGAELIGTALFCLIALIALPWLGPRTGALLVVLILSIVVVGSMVSYSEARLLIDPVYPSISIALCAAVAIAVLYSQEEHQRRAIRDAFGRYLTPAMVERLAADPTSLKLGGELRTLTVLFCDLRNFTSISESMDAPTLGRFMNDYLSRMTDAVLDCGGTLDKYIGDALIAFWNAPLPDERHADNAMAAVAGMRRALIEFNQRVGEDHKLSVDVRFGIGLATGPCSVGNFGSNRRFDYSAIGDDMNVAARLEQATKWFGIDVLAADSVRLAAPDIAWLPIGAVKVKGKAEPFLVHTLIPEGSLDEPERARLVATHEAMIAAWQSGRRADARDQAKLAEAMAPASYKRLYERYAGLLAGDSGHPWIDLSSG